MYRNNFVALDFETCNNDPRSVTQIGAVLVKEGKIVGTFEELIKPDEEYRYFGHASFDHKGIFRNIYDHALLEGKCWSEVGPKFETFCQGLDLVAHNAKFDKTCLYSVNEHFNIDFFPHFHDTMHLCWKLIPESNGKGNCTLENLAVNIFQITTQEEYHNSGHTAFYDASLCAKIFLKLAPELEPKNSDF